MNNFTPADLEALLAEVTELRHENAVLTGLMAGGYAYFFRQLMVGHHAPKGLSAKECDHTLVDALKRILSTQERFGYNYLVEIETVLQKMTQTVPLDPYLDKAKLPKQDE